MQYWVQLFQDYIDDTKQKVWFLPQNPQEFLVLIWPISEIEKAESTLEQPNVFQPPNVFQS